MSYIAKNGRLYTSGASEALTLLDDKFSVNKSYSKGDSCIYNDYLWKFTSDKPAGEWDSSVVEQCRVMDCVDGVNGRLTQVQNQIVPTAAIEVGETASKAYSVGDFLVKNGSLYKVTKAISKDDALTPANIVPTTIGSELSERSERFNTLFNTLEEKNEIHPKKTVTYTATKNCIMIITANIKANTAGKTLVSVNNLEVKNDLISGSQNYVDTITLPLVQGDVVSINIDSLVVSEYRIFT